MNNRFKFRFYDEKNNFMITDEDSDENWNKCIELYDKDEWYFCIEKNLTFILDYFDNKDFVVMQCTGLKDKNGKLIYEGDICRHSKSGEVFNVVWHNPLASFCWQKHEHSHIYSYGELFRAFDYYEVIGNIYTDAHLLEENKND